jgi:hypothetical protein
MERRMQGLGRNDEDAYLTVSQACEIAGIGRTSFYKLLGDPRSGLAEIVNRIPGLGYIRISRRRFRKWLESGPLRPLEEDEEDKEKSLDPCPRRGMSQAYEAESGQREEARTAGAATGPRGARSRGPRPAAP